MNVISTKRHKQQKPLVMSVDYEPFYSQSNIQYLEKVTSEIDNGTAKLEEHELIEI